MHPDVAALLEVQSEDIAIHELEGRLAALQPRIDAMAKERDRAAAALEEARSAVESEERRQRDIRTRLDQFHQLEERNQAQLNAVTSQREATAATAQLDQARRMTSETQRELDISTRRIGELRHGVVEREQALQHVEQQQREARASLDADRMAIDEQLETHRARRTQRAGTVPQALLTRYDRIRSRKRVHAVFPLRGASCANCDTAIPLQRRSRMTGSGATDVCEGCGVLLYAGE